MDKKSNKLISLVAAFSVEEQREASLFLSSPYFNKSKDLTRLFKEICKRLDRQHSLEKESIWGKLWPGKEYNDPRFRKFCSDLLRLLQSFVTLHELQQQSHIKEQLYLQAIGRLEPQKLVEGILRNWDKSTAEYQQHMRESSHKYLHLHLLERQRFDLADYDRRTFDRSNLEVIIDHLDVFYMAEKLKSYNSANSTAFSRFHKYQIRFIPQIIQFIDEHPDYLNYPPLAIHYYNYRMEAQPDQDAFYEAFREKLFQLTADFRASELQQLYQTALNYSSRKINAGKTIYLKEYLKVYRHALEREAVYEDGFLDPLQFKNTILIALRDGQFDWTKNYIEVYQQRIAAVHRENAVNYNYATLYFYQKDYDKALDYLRGVEYENITYNLNAKAMLLAIYYETDAFDALESLFDAISAYLNRHKEIPAHPRKAFRNLVSLTRRLTRLVPGDKKALEKVEADIKAADPVASQNWLLEKAEELR